MLFCLIIALITLIGNHELVVAGAQYGLMLWYQDVLPLLLPFMLISNLFVLKTCKQKNNRKQAIILLFMLGVLCGYPLGAKIASDFTGKKILDKTTASVLLPLCNNISPMFLSGYICHVILKDRYSFIFLLGMLYLPYIAFVVIQLLIINYNNQKQRHKPSLCSNIQANDQSCTNTLSSNDSIVLQSIIQITYVGFYIMLCSILIQFVMKIPGITSNVSTTLCGILEITQGAKAISNACFPPEIKTALILACTSFGGISALFQTNQVIQKSGLSLSGYFFKKLMCASVTGCMTYFLLI